MSELKTTIPKGSWVLITGVTGHVASELARQFLERGYRVRGTARDLAKASWLVDDVFKEYVNKGYFELTHVPHIDAEGGFDASVKGVSAIAHVATIGFDPDPNKVVTPTVAATVSVLKAALREPSVKQFVYTSSIVSHTSPFPGNTTHVTPDTWNDDIGKVAWAPPPYDESRIFPVYMASKTEAERALWKFVADEKPHFQVNSVSPQTIFGKRLNKNGSSPTAGMIPQLYEGKAADDFLQAMIVVDVKDVALLHVAAVLDPEVDGERIQAWGQSCTWNDALAVLRKLFPNRKFIDDIPGGAKRLDLTTDHARPLALLKKWGGGQDGWRTLEQTFLDNLDLEREG